ncbi:MAG: glycosyltransferase family 2 protein [Chloroflexota bacterium]|nr:glycosyltransferase family 2 protein [Chloroflexota bacterium]
MSRVPPATRALAAALGIARTGAWLLALNCAGNLLFAPRATLSFGDLKRLRAPGPWPRVSILVPARNEAANIEACLRGLLAQRYPATEILVCDDRSTDETAAIVRAIAGERGNGRLRLLAGGEQPPGWSGKNWACHQLAEVARGDWLLFTDADTRHRPDSVAAALGLGWRHDADLVSLVPRQLTGSFGERLLVTQLTVIVFAILPLALVPRRWRWTRPFAGANGPFLLFRRDWYRALGGYAAVRETITEDMRFAVETKRRGGRVVLADGGAVLACRMYRDFADVWRGCSRNGFSAARAAPGAILLFAAAWAFFFALPPLALLGLAIRPPRPAQRWGGVQDEGGTPAPPDASRSTESSPPQSWGGRGGLLRLALLGTLGQVAIRGAVGLRHGRPAWEALCQPLGSFLTLGVLVNAWRLHRSGGGFAWRGRRYG